MSKVAVIMGSKSDMPTFQTCFEMLDLFEIEYEVKIVSAHRCPEFMYEFAKNAASTYSLIIAGAGGAAHLPGMVASLTVLPVIGVPVQSKTLSGIDSLYSIVQMPGGVPVGTMAIGSAGAKNAALYAIRIIAITKPDLQEKYLAYVKEISDQVLSEEI